MSIYDKVVKGIDKFLDTNKIKLSPPQAIAAGGGVGLLAADQAEAGGAGKLSAVLDLMKQMSKNKYKGEGNLGRVYKDLKKLDTNFKDFHYEPGSGGNYGTIQLRFPNGDLMETQLASTSHVVADDQLVKRLRGARSQIDPNFKADEGSNYSKWTKVNKNNNAIGGVGAGGLIGGNEMMPNPGYDVLQGAMDMEGDSTLSPEERARQIQLSRDQLTGNMAGIPVGAAEAFFGLPGDLIGVARGGIDAYKADEGQGWDAFEQGFNKPTLFPTTQDIQNVTNPYLPNNITEHGGDGRLTGEFLAPGGYLGLLKKAAKAKNAMTTGGLIGGGSNIE